MKKKKTSKSNQSSSKKKKAPKKKAMTSKKTSKKKTSKSSAPKDFATLQAKRQRDISISEFFAKNRHLLGFDNARKALLTTVKEAVDNSLDACEEARILPEIMVVIEPLDKNKKSVSQQEKFKIIIEDNGPGILKTQIPNIFGKLLYGSKFHQLKQSRGQQGIGISAAAMYGQITTGSSCAITSKTSRKGDAQFIELQMDTNTNKPQILKDKLIPWDSLIEDSSGNKTKHGTRIEITLKGRYVGGKQGVEEFIRQTMVACPHLTVHFQGPDGEVKTFPREMEELPPEPFEIKPHPHGVEYGVFLKFLQTTAQKTAKSFLSSEFSRVGPKAASDIIKKAKLKPASSIKETIKKAEDFYQAVQEASLPAPPTNCLSPIGEEGIMQGLKRLVPAEYYATTTRKPAVYRGNPFVIEAGIAYGGDRPSDTPAEILRFANRVPLLYQQSACGSTKAMIRTDWRKYGISQPSQSLPVGPFTVFIHIASVWVPFTSESKEALADYEEISKEIKLAIMEVGRKVGTYVRRTKRLKDLEKKKNYIQQYLPHVGIALEEILGISEAKKKSLMGELKQALENDSDLVKLRETVEKAEN